MFTRFYKDLRDFSGETKTIICHGVLRQIRSCHRHRVSTNWCVQKRFAQCWYWHKNKVVTQSAAFWLILLPKVSMRSSICQSPVGEVSDWVTWVSHPEWWKGGQSETWHVDVCLCLVEMIANQLLKKLKAVVRESSVSSPSSVFIEIWEGYVHSMTIFGFSMAFMCFASIMWKWVETVNMPWHGLLPHSFNCDPPAAQGTTPCPSREGPSPNVLMPIKVGCMTSTSCFPIYYIVI